MTDLIFPEDFLWGASTSAYQTEGGGENTDWWAAEAAGRVPYRSGDACDSWNRWEADLDLAASLGLTVFRFSVEWARVEPSPGSFDAAALAHYALMARGVRDRGMQCMVVLWHFTNPVWLGGGRAWADSAAPTAFARYAGAVAEALAPHVDWWATINEANTYVHHGWLTGVWPPFRRRDIPAGMRAYSHLATGHRLARAAIRDHTGADARVGLTHVMPWAHPAARGGALSGPMQAFWRWIGAHHFLDKVAGDLDWLGVQYYHDSPCRALGIDDADGSPPRTDMGWRIVPEGLYHVVAEAHARYGLPILVTENGLADADDAQRGRFILDHLAWLHLAIEQGADVRGYLHWSLTDNYEWALGFEPRFGLAAVDYRTFERTLRPSARLYEAIARGNRITGEMGAGR